MRRIRSKTVLRNPRKKSRKKKQEKKTSASDVEKEKTVVQADSGSVSQVAKEAMPSVVAITNMMRYQENGFPSSATSREKPSILPAVPVSSLERMKRNF